MTRTLHACEHPQCFRQIEGRLFGCRPHWYALPTDLRSEVWRTWKARLRAPGDPTAVAAHEAAKAQAVRFWSEDLR